MLAPLILLVVALVLGWKEVRAEWPFLLSFLLVGVIPAPPLQAHALEAWWLLVMGSILLTMCTWAAGRGLGRLARRRTS